jgi:methyltransferase
MSVELIRQIAFVLLILERLIELVIANRNLRWSLSQGGHEEGRSHYKWMVILHVSMLLSMFWEWQNHSFEFGHDRLLFFGGVCVLSQFLRWWVIVTLGRQWNTRIVIIPKAQRITHGPFRFMNHPNYLAVVVEMLFLPIFFGAVWTAALFSLLNLWMIKIRVQAENQALKQLNEI